MKKWPEYTLENVCTRITDGAHHSPKSVLDGLPMASVKDLSRFGINLESCRKITSQDFEKLVRQGCKPEIGDILIAKDGASALDTVCEIKNEINAVLLSSVAILRPDTRKVLSSYLRYYLDADSTRKYMKKAFTTGAAIPRVVLKDFKRSLVNIPPLPTQHKIASILLVYDDLIENNLRRIKILEEMAQMIYQEWFVDFRFPGYEKVKMVYSSLGKIPEGWEVTTFKNIVDCVRDSTKAGDHLSDRFYVPIDCIPRQSLTLLEAKDWEEAQSSLILFNKGDILFGAMRPYFHKVVVAPFKGITRTTCFVLRPKFLDYYAYSLMIVFQENTVSYATAHSQGSTIPYAVWDGSLSELEIIKPSRQILLDFNNILSPLLNVFQNSYSKLINLRKTRDLLLPKLISGELDVEKMDIDTERK